MNTQTGLIVEEAEVKKMPPAERKWYQPIPGSCYARLKDAPRRIRREWMRHYNKLLAKCMKPEAAGDEAFRRMDV